MQSMPDSGLHPAARWFQWTVLVTGVAMFGGALALTSAPPGSRANRAWTQSRRVVARAAAYIPRAAGMAADFATPPVMAATPAPSPAPATTSRRSPWDRPTAEVWPGRNVWTPAIEDEYSRFVARIGEGFATRRCYRLDDCLLNPEVNPLHAQGDVRLGLRPDCADLAYSLRVYFAFKRDLPFGWVQYMGGDGGDPRYLRYGTPVSWSQWTRYPTPRRVLQEVLAQVHSGMFRLSAKVEEGDSYAARIDRASVRPGTSFYDTNGHVLVVCAVHDDGGVDFIDGHPDGSITHKHLNQSYIAGTASWGGGFRNWRPLRVEGDTVTRARNAELADHDPVTQYDATGYVIDGRRVRYDEWVRARLRATPSS